MPTLFFQTITGNKHFFLTSETASEIWQHSAIHLNIRSLPHSYNGVMNHWTMPLSTSHFKMEILKPPHHTIKGL